ncbi:MAG: HAD family hydrolase [Anaerolineae bacterium]|nr:HAD family hydrolase [Anaerolineae bacterium]
MIRVIVFDFGNTVMREIPDFDGKMVDAPHVEAMPHVEEALRALRPDYRLVMASNANLSRSADIRAALRRVGLDGYFEIILSSADLGVNKPDPAFFHKVLEACGCTPGETVMVGDTFEKDVVGAKNVGMRAVWYALEDRVPPPGSPVTPDAVIRDLRDLDAAIRALEG